MLTLKSYVPLYSHGEIQIQMLTHAYQDCLVPDVIQNVMSKLVQHMEYIKTYLYDLFILTNNSFKDYLLKLEIVLIRLSTYGMRANISKSKFFAEQIEYLTP
jgi:predicted nucleotide-binding protein (sugar kinase/HSP70/actin superfamily)